MRATPVLIGAVKRDKLTITKALDIYLTEIFLDDVVGKSPELHATYKKVKRRAAANFVRFNGDVDMREIDREYGRKVYPRKLALKGFACAYSLSICRRELYDS